MAANRGRFQIDEARALLVSVLGRVAVDGRGVIAMVLLSILTIVATIQIWALIGARISAGDDYLVQIDDIEISTPPAWIDSDIRAQVMAATQLDWPLHLLDKSLAEQIAQAFSLHPWVQRVDNVAKTHPARVHVTLTYRRPVAMVKSGPYLRPVDEFGVVLPSEDFSPAEAQSFPLIEGIATPPLALGTAWGDSRVAGAAKIAAVFCDRWQDLNLHRIVPSPSLAASGPTQVHYYHLLTHSGVRVTWGRPPGMEGAGEPPAFEKLALLERYVRRARSLDSAGDGAEFNLVSGEELAPSFSSASLRN